VQRRLGEHKRAVCADLRSACSGGCTQAARSLPETDRGGGGQVRGAWGADVRVVIAGLANTYSSYVTTFEEYGAQRYEGASTIFGPHTLDAYIQVGLLPYPYS
jgi:hypothetical protein